MPMARSATARMAASRMPTRPTSRQSAVSPAGGSRSEPGSASPSPTSSALPGARVVATRMAYGQVLQRAAAVPKTPSASGREHCGSIRRTSRSARRSGPRASPSASSRSIDDAWQTAAALARERRQRSPRESADRTAVRSHHPADQNARHRDLIVGGRGDNPSTAEVRQRRLRTHTAARLAGGAARVRSRPDGLGPTTSSSSGQRRRPPEGA